MCSVDQQVRASASDLANSLSMCEYAVQDAQRMGSLVNRSPRSSLMLDGIGHVLVRDVVGHWRPEEAALLCAVDRLTSMHRALRLPTQTDTTHESRISY
jgi:hypothetical protein